MNDLHILSSNLNDNEGEDKVPLKYIRSDGRFYSLEKNFALTFYEILTNTQEIAQNQDYR